MRELAFIAGGFILGTLGAAADVDVLVAAISSFWLGLVWIPVLAIAGLFGRSMRGTRVCLVLFALGFALGQSLVRRVSPMDETHHLYISIVPVLCFFAALLVAVVSTVLVRCVRRAALPTG